MAQGVGRQDHYKVLGVDPHAAEEVIRGAYRALVSKYHPDKNPGDRHAELKLKQLNAAFAVLGNQQKRKQYDELTSGPEPAEQEQGEQARPRPSPPTTDKPKERWKPSVEGPDRAPRPVSREKRARGGAFSRGLRVYCSSASRSARRFSIRVRNHRMSRSRSRRRSLSRPLRWRRHCLRHFRMSRHCFPTNSHRRMARTISNRRS
jgi:curved DNA-binding protein CbpA